MMTISRLQPLLRLGLTGEDERRKHVHMQQLPIKVLQIGEGNFLRGFADWMLQESIASGKYHGSVVLTPPTPRGAAKLKQIEQQEGLYTLVVQGLQDGQKVEKRQMISVFRDYVDPYTEWERFLQLAELESLDVVISNTTEAGLVYTPIDYVPGEPMTNFPARLTVLLQRRFAHFNGDPKRGLMILPCELIENNGDVLREYVLRYGREFGFGEEFCSWVEQSQLFLNNLVDRIVTGMPGDEEYARLTGSWGYEDSFLTTAEPYHLWAIQGDPSLDRRLPLAQAGLNVQWVPDLKPFRQRKVHILNGAHTLMMPAGLLQGKSTVREVMEDSELGEWVRQTVDLEIIPALPILPEELKRYAAETFERFANPYLEHRLQDIAMNSISKFQSRLLPVLKAYTEKFDQLPEQLVYGLAALLRLYQVQETEQQDGTKIFTTQLPNGSTMNIRDHSGQLGLLAGHWAGWQQHDESSCRQVIHDILADTGIWNEDLTAIAGLSEAVASKWIQMEVNPT
ncbi:tagaturonate reductase [Paenibacillus wulumuqiensis]|uniref:tagaturonate reductase n=1 Tax=Paenibacillus wulumuqiensis TaxID=1567107 RepID=UPI001F3DED4F|nr:tagaturonate reductase [Paenibacillus wulumuqiensis]